MSYLPTGRQKLTPLVEYYIELDEDESVPDDSSVFETPRTLPVSPRVEFECDKYHTTKIMKGMLYSFILGAGIGFYLGRLSKKS